MGKKIKHARVLQLLQTFLKAIMVQRGGDLRISADDCVRAENEFDLKINDDGDSFRLSMTRTKKGDKPSELSIPDSPKLWTPGD